jgi:uncharacterized membrane protein
MIARLIRHLFFPHHRLHRCFPAHTLSAIERTVKAAERTHLGEIRFAVESALEPGALWAHTTAHHRALQVFSELHVWDTERNNGVLVYVLLADRVVEIVADRGLSVHVSSEQWKEICHTMERAFARDDYESGSLAAIEAVSEYLARYFPAGDGENVNELPDRPYVR